MILIAAYNAFCREHGRAMKPYNMTKAAIDKFCLSDYRIGSPLVHWTSLGSEEARERESWSKSIKQNKKDYNIFKHGSLCWKSLPQGMVAKDLALQYCGLYCVFMHNPAN